TRTSRPARRPSGRRRGFRPPPPTACSFAACATPARPAAASRPLPSRPARPGPARPPAPSRPALRTPPASPAARAAPAAPRRPAAEDVAETLRGLGHTVIERDPPLEAGPMFRGAARWFRGVRDDARATGAPRRLERKTRVHARIGAITPAARVARSLDEEAGY